MFSTRDGLRRSISSFAISFLGFGVYLALAQVGLAIATINDVTSPVWPAAGFAVAYLYHFGWRFAPALFLGSLASDIFIGIPSWASLGIAINNVGTALFGSWILKHIRYPLSDASDKDFNILQYVGGVLFLCLIPPVASATFGSGLISAAGIARWDDFPSTWITWWLGDVLGILLIFPIVFDLFLHSPFKRFLRNSDIFRKTWLVLLCLVLCGLVSFFIFDTRVGRPYTFLIFLLLLFGAVTLRSLGINLVILIVGIYSVYSTSIGAGPFGWSTINDNLIALQIFLFSVGLTGLVVRIFGDYLRRKVVLIFLTCGWLLAGSVFYIFYSSREQLDQSHFQSLVTESEEAIFRRFIDYENILNGGVGLFMASDHVTEEDWRIFAQTLNIDTKNVGAVGLGYIIKVDKKDLPEYIRKRRTQIPDFRIKDVPHTAHSFEEISGTKEFRIIHYIEPGGNNRRALGLNVATEGRRLRSQNLARDTGKSVISEDLVLSQDDSRQKGFIFYIPVYMRGKPSLTVEDRRKNLRGWVYAPFTYSVLMNELRKEITKQVDFFLFKHDEINAQGLLYSSAAFSSDFLNLNHEGLIRIQTIAIGERKYSVVWRKGPDFVTSQNATLPWIGIFGTLLTLAAAWIYINGLISGQRAEVLVQVKTRELSKRELLWRTLMETVPAGVFKADQDGNLRYANPKWCKMTGRAFRDMEGVPWITMVHPEDFRKVESAWKESVQKRKNFEMQFRFMNSRNEARWVTSIISYVGDKDGENLGYVGVQIDVTDRVRTQMQREQEQLRLAQSSKMASLGEMAGGIAHEINNPLAIIIGRSAQIKKLLSTDDLDRERLIEGLNKIESTVDRIARTVKGLRGFSRDSENDPMEKISIIQVIEDSLALSNERLSGSGVEIKTDLHEANILGRPSQISQVLVNLLSNSLDALEPLEKKWISVESRAEDEHVLIRVVDSGKGIEDEVVQKLTQPFFTTKGVGKGTGLGLSISKQIIENHGGTLNYELYEGHTSFKIELPLIS